MENAWFLTYLKRQSDWLEKTRGNLVVAATVIATMSFQLMVNPPGGVFQAPDKCFPKNETDTSCKMVGTAVLEDEDAKRVYYLLMVITSAMSFSASMSLILLVISGFRLRNRLILATMVIFMVVAVLAISTAFYCAMNLIHYDDPIINYVMDFYLGFWFLFPGLVLFCQLIRFLWWFLRLVLCCLPRGRRSTPPPPSAP